MYRFQKDADSRISFETGRFVRPPGLVQSSCRAEAATPRMHAVTQWLPSPGVGGIELGGWVGWGGSGGGSYWLAWGYLDLGCPFARKWVSTF